MRQLPRRMASDQARAAVSEGLLEVPQRLQRQEVMTMHTQAGRTLRPHPLA